MEILNPFSKTEDIAEAVRGGWGKDCGTYLGKEFKIVYCGQVVFGIGEKAILDKKVSIAHYDWEKLSTNVYMAIVK